MEPIGCLEMSVRNYDYSLRNNPEVHSSQLLWGGPEIKHIKYLFGTGE
jgi:hypothetical protein